MENNSPAAQQLQRLYEILFHTYGPQYWWPGTTPFEVMVGAILTQNTTWSNVERAIQSLQGAGCLTVEAILAAPPATLGALIRPVGYFNLKTRRLQNFCRWYIDRGQLWGMTQAATQDLRRELLAINGIGPETADDILLYALERPVFVIDVYTRRLGARLSLVRGDEHYEILRTFFETAIFPNVGIYQEYHALIVRHAKDICQKKQPRCNSCVLREFCPARIIYG